MEKKLLAKRSFKGSKFAIPFILILIGPFFLVAIAQQSIILINISYFIIAITLVPQLIIVIYYSLMPNLFYYDQNGIFYVESRDKEIFIPYENIKDIICWDPKMALYQTSLNQDGKLIIQTHNGIEYTRYDVEKPFEVKKIILDMQKQNEKNILS